LTASTNSSPESLALRRLAPAFYERVWGVDNLSPWFPEAAPPEGKRFGEAWFTNETPLPILVKFLFTSANLSVQVHPAGECGVGKTEMWHILRAEPGARIALGFERDLSAAELRAAALSGEIEQLLRWIPVSAGETYFIPAGAVHAIGAGITLCEIQQNSDITYRLYDYGRPRELHLDLGLAAADLKNWSHPGACAACDLPDGWKRLAACRYFAADTFDVNGRLEYRPDPARFELLICLDGAGQIDEAPCSAGDVWLIPAGAAKPCIETSGAMRLLRSYVP
jgi:mannose-6-phosphate isomerase